MLVTGARSVAVFDVSLPPAVAFIRSLGRAGVPVTAFAYQRTAAGRFSRHVTETRTCPSPARTDEFVAWLADKLDRGEIDLVAPTSDRVTFCVAAAAELLGRSSADIGYPEPEAVRTALFKDRFGLAMSKIGFPTPCWRTPTTLAEARSAAEEIGYPVVLKPRSHVGVGATRGTVVRAADQLDRAFVPYSLTDDHTAVLSHDADLAWPLIQRYHELGTVEIVSVTGCLDRDGSPLAVSHARKVSQLPRRLGVGTMFEPAAEPPFGAAALDAVQEVLGSGVFELEVLVDKVTGEHWAVDLNPRGFGQIALDIALGHDLPRLWYTSVTGTVLEPTAPHNPSPSYWHEAVTSYVGLGVRIARGPRRGAILRHALGRVRAARVEAAFERHDPLPGLMFTFAHLRHPRSLLRPFLRDVELGPDQSAATAWEEIVAG
jgi:predicted ATP-grasp superfamily ATP-dependent carboligase